MTTSLDPQSSAAGEQPAAKPSPWARMIGVFVAPGETMRDIALRPDIVVPLVILVLLSLVSTFFIVERIDFGSAIRAEMEARGNEMGKEDAERMIRFGSAFAKAAAWASPVLSIVFLAAIAGIMLLAFRLFGGEGTFKQAFAVTTYSWYPYILKSLIATIVVLTKKGTLGAEEMVTLVQSNPASFADMRTQPALFSLLSSLDLFTFWVLVLMTFGFAAMSRFTRGRSAMVVFGLWAAVVIVKVGFAALGSMG